MAIAGALLASWFLCSELVRGEESLWEQYTKAAKLYEQNGSSAEILSLCDEIRKGSSEPFLIARASLLQSQVLVKQNDYRKAHKALEELLLMSKKLPAAVLDEARLRSAQIYLQEGQSDRALAMFEKVAQNGGAEASGFFRQEARLGLAWQLSNANHPDAFARVDSLLQALVQDQRVYEQDERVLMVRARRELANNRPDAAIKLLSACEGAPALSYLARAYEQASKPMMAVGILKKIHDHTPNSPAGEEALFRAGDVFMRAADWMAAREQFNRFLQTYPTGAYAAEARFRLGWTYIQNNEFEAALKAFRSVNLPERQSHISYMEAECLRQMGAGQPGKLQEAINKYNSIVALDPNSTLAPLANLRAAIARMEKGDEQDAIINLRQFLSLHPKDDLASAATFFLAQQQGGSYFEEILQKYVGTVIFDAALVSLQKRDYDAGGYQEVINRHSQFQGTKPETSNDYQRAQHLILAEAYYYLRQYEAAQREYAAVESKSDDELSQKAAIGKAWCVLQSGQLEAAAGDFENLRSQLTGVQQTQVSYGLATAYFLQKRYDDAIRCYPISKDRVVEPELVALAAKSLFKVGESYSRLQLFGQAIDYWKKLVQDYPNTEWAPQAQYRLADTYFRAHHFDEALAAFQQGLDSYPGHAVAVESSLRMAQCEYNAGKYEQAIANFEKFIKDYPQHSLSKDALEGVQLCYYQLGQIEGATTALKKVIEQAPGTMLAADARFRLANSYLEAGQTEEAIRAFKEILTLYPGTSYAMDAQLALAKACFAQENYELANEEFSRFIQYFPDSPNIAEAAFQLGVGYFSLQSYVSAAEKFNEVIQRYPQSEFYASALQNIGWCYDRMGEKEQALAAFSDYLASNPSGKDQSKIKLQVAGLQSEKGNVKEAMASYQALQKDSDGDVAAEAALRLGQALLEMKQNARAKESFLIAVRVGSKDNYYRLKSLAELAYLHEVAKAWDQAIACYQQIIDSTSDETWVSAAQERLQALSSLAGTNGHGAKVSN
ncbi:MAG TPA: outer membrane protein assembly factor BamD [bacterium]